MIYDIKTLFLINKNGVFTLLYLIVNRWLIKLFITVKNSIMFIDDCNCFKGGFNLKNKLIWDENNVLFYKEEKLDENNTCAKIAHMGNDGKQVYNTKYYNLDMIISIGFRVNSKKAIKFRTWANNMNVSMIEGD